MAKKENTTEVTGGLTADLDFSTQETGGEPRRPAHTQKTSTLTEGYQKTQQQKYETRDTKMNILVKPSTARKLKEAVEKREIRSRNDLINYLLEKYFAEDEKNRG